MLNRAECIDVLYGSVVVLYILNLLNFVCLHVVFDENIMTEMGSLGVLGCTIEG